MMTADKVGKLSVYKCGGEVVLCSFAQLYAYRDDRLAQFNAIEFKCLFAAKKMGEKDKETYKKFCDSQYVAKDDGDDTTGIYCEPVCEPVCEPEVNQVGRPKYVFYFKQGLGLEDYYMIVPRVKWGVVAFSGAPVPRMPMGDAPATRAFSNFMIANFVPWACSQQPNLTIETWEQWVEALAEEAGWYSEQDPRPACDMSHTQLIAASRISMIEKLVGAQHVPKMVLKMLSSHRARARDFWGTGTNKPQDTGGGSGLPRDLQDIVKDMAHIKDMDPRVMEREILKRENQKAFAAILVKNLPSQIYTQGHLTKLIAGPILGMQWPTANAPSTHTVSTTVAEEANALLQENLPPRTLPQVAREEAGSVVVGEGGVPMPLGFINITDVDYDAAYTKWKLDTEAWKNELDAWEARNGSVCAHPGAKPKAPLNPEQRAVCREFFAATYVFAKGKQRGDTVQTIMLNMCKNGIVPIIMMHGPGGTGKSAVVHEIKHQMLQHELGEMVVTAYTGVAAAPFGGPTLLSMLSLGIQSKSYSVTPELCRDAQKMQLARDKFYCECGVRIQDVSAIVVDEISFSDAKLYGHFDVRLQQLTGNIGTPCGGIPILLAGDNHQKCNGLPWYKSVVEHACDPTKNAIHSSSKTALMKGIHFLTSAKMVPLHRLMRAQGDATFTKHLMDIRKTDEQHPIPIALLKSLRSISPEDIKSDETWRFAPIGVISRFERDTLNIAQLHHFAHAFQLPVYRWKKKLLNAIVDAEIEEELYMQENSLWQYFVFGAPILLTSTIKATRKLANGTPALLHSLVFHDNDVPECYRAQKCGYCTFEIPAPRFVNCIVGGAKDKPVMWHSIQLDDLSQFITTVIPNEQVISLTVLKDPEQVMMHSKYAVEKKIKAELKTCIHQYDLAFAMTDFKLQGRTLDKLVMLICKRSKAPFMNLPEFYVLISRVRSLNGLRLLFEDQKELQWLHSKKKHCPKLYAWEQGYDSNGIWDNTRCGAALLSVSQKLQKTITPIKKANFTRHLSPTRAAPGMSKRKHSRASCKASKNLFGANVTHEVKDNPKTQKQTTANTQPSKCIRLSNAGLTQQLERVGTVRVYAHANLPVPPLYMERTTSSPYDSAQYMELTGISIRVHVVDFYSESMHDHVVGYIRSLHELGATIKASKQTTDQGLQHAQTCGFVAAYAATALYYGHNILGQDWDAIDCLRAVDPETWTAGDTFLKHTTLARTPPGCNDRQRLPQERPGCLRNPTYQNSNGEAHLTETMVGMLAVYYQANFTHPGDAWGNFWDVNLLGYKATYTIVSTLEEFLQQLCHFIENAKAGMTNMQYFIVIESRHFTTIALKVSPISKST